MISETQSLLQIFDCFVSAVYNYAYLAKRLLTASLYLKLPNYCMHHLYTPSRQLRSSADTPVLRMPSFRTKASGQRPFSDQPPKNINFLSALDAQQKGELNFCVRGTPLHVADRR